jgi:hypothetical protein
MTQYPQSQLIEPLESDSTTLGQRIQEHIGSPNGVEQLIDITSFQNVSLWKRLFNQIASVYC